MALEIREIVASEWLPEAKDLIRAHQAECEPHLANEVKLFAERIAEMESDGSAITMGAFHNGKLIGYCMSALHTHLHYSALAATCLSIYVAPAYRRGSAGIRLMAAAEAAAVERGVTYVVWSAKPGSRLDKLMQAQGRKVEDHVYVKVMA